MTKQGREITSQPEGCDQAMGQISEPFQNNYIQKRSLILLLVMCITPWCQGTNKPCPYHVSVTMRNTLHKEVCPGHLHSIPT